MGLKRSLETPEQRAARLARTKEKDAARSKFASHIQRGLIIRQPCEICGETPAEGHHDDYDKPLEVRWLCFRHHRELHKALAAKEEKQ